MPTPTVENYLKALYVQPRAPGHEPCELIPMGQVAEAMRVSPGTATSMMKTLAEAGLVEYEPRAGVRLSERGLTLALQILRRHRLIEQFLVQTLGLDWSEVHDEAEELEHAISDKVLERIDLLLGHPDTDPHGDPIPPSHGPPVHIELTPLSLVGVGIQVTVARVLDQQPDFLNFAYQHGLTPGSHLTVLAHQPAADAITYQPEVGQSVTLGSSAADKILILCEPNSP